MKTYGLSTIIGMSCLIAAFTITLFLLPKGSGLHIGMALPLAFAISQLVNMPLIKVDKQRIRITTLNPLHKNIRVDFANVRKIIVEVNNHTFRATMLMRDGSEKSTLTSRYYNMKSLYEQLVASGVEVESHGVGTADWGN